MTSRWRVGWSQENVSVPSNLDQFRPFLRDDVGEGLEKYRDAIYERPLIEINGYVLCNRLCF